MDIEPYSTSYMLPLGCSTVVVVGSTLAVCSVMSCVLCCWQVSTTELVDDVQYSIVTDSNTDRSVTQYFSIDSSTGVVSTTASLAQSGMYY